MKFIKTLFTKPILLAFLFVLIVFLPTSISAPPEGVERQHISTIGLDKSDDGGIELSLLAHVSKQSDKYNQAYILTSTTAQSLPYAFAKIGSITGREVTLTHTATLVISQELLQDGLHKYLDYFYRNDNVANDTFVVCTPGKAKDLLNFEKERINSAGYGLEEVLVHNAENTYFSDSNIESFYKGYFSPSHSSLVAIAELEPNPDGQQLLQSGGSSGGSSGDGQSGGSSGEGSGDAQNQPVRIKDLAQLGLLKYGKLVDILDRELIFGMNLVNSSTHNVFFTIKNFSDQHYQNADIELNIVVNRVSYITDFENNKPVFTINSLVSLGLQSVVADEALEEYYHNNINPLSLELKNEVIKNLKNKFAAFLKKMIDNQADTFGVYSAFNNQHSIKFQKWLQTLDDPEDFLSKIEFRMSINPILTT